MGLIGVIHQSGIHNHPVLKYYLGTIVSSHSRRSTECVIDILTLSSFFFFFHILFSFCLFLPLCYFLDLPLVQSIIFSLVSGLLLRPATEFLL